MPIIDKLERQENLTEAERELALFVLANTNEVMHMSIAELAEQSFTSNATVIRLCRKLGLKGYRDFRIELTQDMERRRADVRSVDVHLRFPDRERADGNIATFYSQECLRYLLNCVYAELFSFEYNKNMSRKAEVDALTSGSVANEHSLNAK